MPLVVQPNPQEGLREPGASVMNREPSCGDGYNIARFSERTLPVTRCHLCFLKAGIATLGATRNWPPRAETVKKRGEVVRAAQ